MPRNNGANGTRKRGRSGAAVAILVALLVLALCPLLTGCTPAAPKGVEITLSEEYVEVRWEAQKGATYALEYRWDDGGLERVTSEETSYRISRRAGAFSVRVAAINRYGQGQYGEWAQETVAYLALPAPAYALQFTPRTGTDDGGNAYTYFQASLNSGWQPVTVPHEGSDYVVQFYQVAVVGPGGDEALAKLHPETYQLDELLEHKFNWTKAGDWKIYVRAVPYIFVPGENGGQIIYEPTWLNARYVANDSDAGWRLTTRRVA